MKTNRKITAPQLIEMKNKHEKICCLTAYDWLFASLLDSAGLDLILVGDSVGMVFSGYEKTIPVTLDDMIYHTKAVSRGILHALLITDMPFLSFQVSSEKALLNAGRLIKEGGAEGVKVEGGEPIAESIKKITDVGIPVMGHLGLTPQSINQYGGYRIRGKNQNEVNELKKDAKILEQAGVFAIVLEKIPAELAKEITESLSIPTIGIGAGPHCDGQILVTYDMLGLFEEFRPKFVKQYTKLAKTIREAINQYVIEVRKGTYPSKEESYS